MTAKIPSLFDKCVLWWPGEHVAQAAAPKTITPAGDVKQILPFRGAGVGVFDGNGSYIKCNYSSGFEPGSEAFTVECLFYIPNVSGYKTIFAFTADFHFGIFLNGSKINYFASSNGTSWNLISGNSGSLNGAGSNTVTAGVWHHLAFTRSGNNWYGFYDGKLDLSVTVPGTIVSRSETLNIGRWGNNGYWMNGYITEFNYVIGTCKYSSPFVYKIEQIQHDINTKLLLHFKHGDLVRPGVDYSSGNLSYLPVGNIHQTNASISPAGNTGVTIFNESSYIQSPVNTGDILGLSGSNLTIEFYIKYTGTISANSILFMGYEPNDSDRLTFIVYRRDVFGRGAGYGYAFASVPNQIRWEAIADPQLNVWYHIALVKTGLSLALYINGVLQTVTEGSLTQNIPARVTYRLQIGKYRESYYYINAQMSEFRISNIARYSTTFVPTIVPFVTDDNTTTLLHFNGLLNAIQDSSGANTLITMYNNMRQISPPIEHGGVAYLDGTGDYLVVTSSIDFTFGTGAYTVEGWFYAPSFISGNYNDIGSCIFDNRSSAFYDGVVLFINNSGRVSVTELNTWDASHWMVSANYVVPIKSWFHLAIVRDTSVRVYINGKQVLTYSYIYNCTSTFFGIGAVIDYRDASASYKYTGYMSDVRVLKGIAKYTTDFVSPTQPFQPDSNTKLLLHFWNREAPTVFLDSSGPADYDEFPIIPSGVTVTPAGSWTKNDLGTNKSVMRFDGSTNYIQVTNSVTSLGTGDWAIFVWFKSLGTSGNHAGIFGNSYYPSIATGMYLLKIKTTSNIVSFFYRNGSTDVNIDTSFNPSDGNWHCIVATRIGTAFTIYVNGISQATATLPSGYDFTNTTYAGQIGYTADVPSYLNGNLKDLLIYKGRALTLPEIKLIMARTHPITGTGMIPGPYDYWRLS